jgi:hypothetical protein
LKSPDGDQGCAEPSVPACDGCRSRTDRPPLRSGGSLPVTFLITEDRLGLATSSCLAADGPGCTSTLIAGDALAARSELAAWIAGPGPASGRSPASFIWRPRAAWEAADAPLATWRGQLFRHEKSLFLCCALRREDGGRRSLSFRSARSAAASAAVRSPRGLSLQGGGVGLLKSLREERPTLRVKAVDVDPGAAACPVWLPS